MPSSPHPLLSFNTNVLLGWEPLYRDPLSARGHRPFRSSFSLHATANDFYDPTLDITVYLRLKLTPHSLPTGRQHRTQKIYNVHSYPKVYLWPTIRSVSLRYNIRLNSLLRRTVRLYSISTVHRQTQQPIYGAPSDWTAYLRPANKSTSLSTIQHHTQKPIYGPWADSAVYIKTVFLCTVLTHFFVSFYLLFKVSIYMK